MKVTAGSAGAHLLTDMAYISGLVVANAIPSRFGSSDSVTTTKDQSLRGPCRVMIFYQEGVCRTDKACKVDYYTLENATNSSVFPGHHGRPNNDTITALAVALSRAQSFEFEIYAHNVVAHARILPDCLKGSCEEGEYGYTLLINITDRLHRERRFS